MYKDLGKAREAEQSSNADPKVRKSLAPEELSTWYGGAHINQEDLNSFDI